MKEILRRINYIPKPRPIQRRGLTSKFQLQKICESFPDAQIVKKKGNSFSVEIKLRPTEFSQKYDIRIDFDKSFGTRVFVINEVLKVAENRSKLPHVYSHVEQRLCLYSPSKGEWTKEKLIVSTIIPWICDWLFYYELWLSNGQWYGGGHDEYR